MDRGGPFSTAKNGPGGVHFQRLKMDREVHFQRRKMDRGGGPFYTGGVHFQRVKMDRGVHFQRVKMDRGSIFNGGPFSISHRHRHSTC